MKRLISYPNECLLLVYFPLHGGQAHTFLDLLSKWSFLAMDRGRWVLKEVWQLTREACQSGCSFVARRSLP